MSTKFRDLSIGDSFDFIDDNAIGYNTFFLRCRKTSARCYTDQSGVTHRIGSLLAKVYHVTKE